MKFARNIINSRLFDIVERQLPYHSLSLVCGNHKRRAPSSFSQSRFEMISLLCKSRFVFYLCPRHIDGFSYYVRQVNNTAIATNNIQLIEKREAQRRRGVSELTSQDSMCEGQLFSLTNETITYLADIFVFFFSLLYETRTLCTSDYETRLFKNLFFSLFKSTFLVLIPMTQYTIFVLLSPFFFSTLVSHLNEEISTSQTHTVFIS